MLLNNALTHIAAVVRRPPRHAEGGAPSAPPYAIDPDPGCATNPYVEAYARGRSEFDSVFGDLARGRRAWQVAAYAALAVAGTLALGLVTLATRSRITPYVVEVDRLGRAQAFGPAEQLRPTDQRVVMSQLATFVRDIRTVLADPSAQEDLVRRSYAFVDRDAATWLNAYFAAPGNDARLLSHDLTRLVEVTSVLLVPEPVALTHPGLEATRALSGTATWKVSWTESSFPRGAAGLPTQTAWEGYFSTRIIPPTTTERITVNPLGLYITAINWTQLAERPLTPVPAPGVPSSDSAAPRPTTRPSNGVEP